MKSPSKFGKAEAILGLLVVISTMLYAFVFSSDGALSAESLRSALLSLGMAGPLIYIAIIAIAVIIVPVPSIPFVLVAGYVYGPVAALAFTIVGGTAGSLSAFLLARKLGRERIRKHLAKVDTMQILDRFDTKLGFTAIFVMRLVPLFNFDIISYAAGLTNISVRKFAVASAVGMVPVTAGYVLAGSAAFELNLLYLGIAALALMALFGMAWLFRGKIKQLTGWDMKAFLQSKE